MKSGTTIATSSDSTGTQTLSLDLGSFVRLQGLQRVDLNGLTGAIVATKAKQLKNENKKKDSVEVEVERYQVEIETDDESCSNKKMLLVKPENLVRLSFIDFMTANGFTIVKCTPFPDETVHPILLYGGGTYNSELHVDFLPRQAMLPTSKKKKFTFNNEITKEAFSHLFDNGDFVAAWRYRNETSQHSLYFNFALNCSSVEEAERHSPVLRHKTLVLVRLVVPKEFIISEGNVGVATKHSYGPNQLIPEFAMGCAYEQRTILVHRVLQHLLRQHGASLPSFLLGNLCQMVKQFLSQDGKSMREYLDMSVTRVDIEGSIDIEPGPQLAFHQTGLVDVGEALEALEQFELAGRVYIKEAESSESQDFQWRVYINAGVAFRRAFRLDTAEQCYIKALHIKYQVDGHSFQFDNPDSTRLLDNVIRMYAVAVDGDMMTPLKSVFMVLCTLLSVLNFQTTESCPEMRLGSQLHQILKNEYRQRPRALQVLTEAVRIGTVEGFRSTLLRCLPDGFGCFLTGGSTPTRRTVLNSTRKVVKDKDKLKRADYVLCHNPSCTKLEKDGADKGTFMRCPCKAVHYCGKQCQIAHWKEHKKSCPYQAAKTQQQQSSSVKK